MADWIFEDGRSGSRMVMHGPWSSDACEALRNGGIKEVELNYDKGWKGSDYSFLRQLPDLESLTIVDWFADDVSAVNDLPELRILDVTTNCKSSLDFSRWPRLEECALEWRPKADSLFGHSGIKTLFINKYNKSRDLRDFTAMSQLESLRLYSPRRLESLEGIESLIQLTFLGLVLATKLPSLIGVENLSKLQHLNIDTCRRICDIGPVAELRSLKEFRLFNCGDISSISPLVELQNLEEFDFGGSTKILDGDLSVLQKLPHLQSVGFKERPHYSHSKHDFQR